MKLLTRDTDYAVRALCSIARSGKEKISAADLVKELAMPRPFIRKIMQVLGKNGIVKSYKGPGGGFAIAVDPRDISLGDIVKIFQGPFRLNECSFKKMNCPNKSACVLRKRICAIEKGILSELRSIAIGSLVKKGS
jgi:Rrf2 family protein